MSFSTLRPRKCKFFGAASALCGWGCVEGRWLEGPGQWPGALDRVRMFRGGPRVTERVTVTRGPPRNRGACRGALGSAERGKPA
jgi:hypothetical protein